MNNPHDYLITSPTPSRPVDPDNADSWVMLNQSGFVKLGNERVLQKLESRISCELSVPSELRARCAAFHRKSDRGTLFLTNKRIVYLPAKRSAEFESFSAPILKFQDSRGGIPADIPRVQVRFTFSDGGMMDFNEAYIRLRERLHQYQEMRREMGPGADVPDEPLPAYEAEDDSSANPGTAPVPAAVSSLAAPAATAREQRSDSSASRRPDEPPPAYDEAQAQQISIRLEDHIRDEANRGDNQDN